MNIPATVVSIVLAGVAANANAVQTQVRVGQCENCSAAQMLAKAKNAPPGVTFVYDLSHHVIRKFEVYLDSTCAPAPVPQGETSGMQKTDERDPTTDCGTFKDAVPMLPVDPDVQSAFDALYQTWLINPSLADFAKTESQQIPRDPNTNRPFDLVEVAWDYPQGAYDRFNDLLWDTLRNKATANELADGLGDYLYDWKVASTNAGVNLGVGGVFSVILTWDRGGTIRLEICDAARDCARFTVTTNGDGLASLEYEGVWDNDNHMYPSESGQAPGSLTRFRFQSPLFAEHFAGQLRPYISIPTNMCPGISWLNTTRQNGRIIFQSWECAPAD